MFALHLAFSYYNEANVQSFSEEDRIIESPLVLSLLGAHTLIQKKTVEPFIYGPRYSRITEASLVRQAAINDLV